MNAQNAHEYLPLIYALANGKTIQFQEADPINEWKDLETVDFTCSAKYYRIKPEPRTFEMWLSPSSGAMFPFSTFPNDQHDMERITVHEVL